MPAASRDDLATQYLEQLPYEPYPVQEEALLAWFTTDRGILVAAPTGTGKTLIAQAALFEALHTGKIAYYTTPLIALTDQKFQEMQQAAVSWGFKADDIGLVTGNRKVNPDARVLVVVAEVLLNRLLHESAFSFDDVSAVVMDEFHSFNDPERGIVWELTLSMLPKHVRLLLLSATVGNTAEFMGWLQRAHGRRLDLVQSSDRKIPLRYHWVADELLNEQLERMARGDDAERKTPTLVFCFNRDECWNVAEELKGKDMLAEGQQKLLAKEMTHYDWSQGIGPKLKTLLMRGVGVHHAGVLPRYKRIVEDLFQRKLLTVCVCTETLSAGMNLPARSVLMSALMKGPRGKKSLIDPSVAHQIFGRAGRPQFDTEGHVYALAHEDDVKIERFKARLNQIPEDTKDPLLIRKRKELKKKMPKRRAGEQYWTMEQFDKLVAAPPTQLKSQGAFPWRLLAYMLSVAPEVSRLRQAVSKRLMDAKQSQKAQQTLDEMLLTLEAGSYVTLSPQSPLAKRIADAGVIDPPLGERLQTLAAEGRFGVVEKWSGQYEQPIELVVAGDEFVEDADEFGSGLEDAAAAEAAAGQAAAEVETEVAQRLLAPLAPLGRGLLAGGEGESLTGLSLELPPSEISNLRAEIEPGDVPPVAPPSVPLPPEPPKTTLTSTLKFLLAAQGFRASSKTTGSGPTFIREDVIEEVDRYEALIATPTQTLSQLLTFKSINPLYGMFLIDVLPHADGPERVQAIESTLGFPIALVKALRIPRAEYLPPSLFTQKFLNPELLQRGVATQTELAAMLSPEQLELPPEERTWPITFPDKLWRLFQTEFPSVTDMPMTPVWAAGELLHYGGDFNKLVTSRKIVRQEGILFRHVLRFILLCEEFMDHLTPGSAWHSELIEISGILTDSCRFIDPHSTDMMIESAKAADITTIE